jgi:hypothetical protein
MTYAAPLKTTTHRQPRLNTAVIAQSWLDSERARLAALGYSVEQIPLLLKSAVIEAQRLADDMPRFARPKPIAAAPAKAAAPTGALTQAQCIRNILVRLMLENNITELSLRTHRSLIDRYFAIMPHLATMARGTRNTSINLALLYCYEGPVNRYDASRKQCFIYLVGDYHQPKTWTEFKRHETKAA